MMDDRLLQSSSSLRPLAGALAWGAEVSGSACAKVILLGEHTVLYGSRALALPVRSVRLEAKLTGIGPGKETQHKSDRFGSSLLESFEEAAYILGLPPKPFRARTRSQIPIGSGLGSSAAFAVAALRAVCALHHKTPPAATLQAAAGRRLEHRFHGASSGLDPAVIAYEAPIVYSIAAGAKVLHPAIPETAFVLVDSRMRSPTALMVSQARPFFSHGREGERRTQICDALVESGLAALTSGDRRQLAQAMEEAGAMLAAAGLVPPPLVEIIAKMRHLGCLGSKVTGAGGGGSLVGVLPQGAEKTTLERLRQDFGRGRVRTLTPDERNIPSVLR